LRHVKLTLLLAVILALSLAPAILLRFYPRETLGYLLNPLSSIIESQTRFSRESIAAFSLVATFVVAVLAASALLLVLAKEVLRSVRES
jgi:predicted PurR-regulated permease PerM